MPIKRMPTRALRPFVAIVWAGDNPASKPAPPIREHVLPTGMMHLVFRLSDRPLRLLGSHADLPRQSIGDSIVGGARSRFYIREVSMPSPSVGAVLRPGVAELLFGATAAELSERHTPLEDLWGASARSVHNLLYETTNPNDRLAILESVLLARLPRVRSMHPAVAAAIDEMHAFQSVDEAVKRSGLSHRHFITLFRRAVGLAPKTYSRILRFQNALKSVNRGEVISLAGVAADSGYSDQAHFNREFLELTGVTPGAYSRFSPSELNHLPVDGRSGTRT